MDFALFVTLFLNGITFAGLLFVVASGLTMVYGLMRLVNMGHGNLYILGACLGYFAYKAASHHWVLGLLAGGLAMMLIYLVLQKTLFQFTLNNMTKGLMVSLGVSWIALDIVEELTKGETKTFSPDGIFRLSIPIGELTYPMTRIFVLVIAILELIILVTVIKKTRLGQIIRAGVDDRDMVSALGINIKQIFLWVFAFSGLLVGIGGVIGGTMNGFSPANATSMQTYAMMIIIVGGRGDIMGTGLASLVIGLAYSFLSAFMPNIAMIIIFTFVMAVMILKPNGLLGKEARKS